jgi:hypothetical protein
MNPYKYTAVIGFLILILAWGLSAYLYKQTFSLIPLLLGLLGFFIMFFSFYLSPKQTS